MDGASGRRVDERALKFGQSPIQRGWDYLQRLQYSPQAPRPRHILADPEAQTAFKKPFARS